MKISELSYNQVDNAANKVAHEVRKCLDAALRGDRGEAYAAAERTEHAAHELKLLLALTPDELLAALGKE